MEAQRQSSGIGESSVQSSPNPVWASPSSSPSLTNSLLLGRNFNCPEKHTLPARAGSGFSRKGEPEHVPGDSPVNTRPDSRDRCGLPGSETRCVPPASSFPIRSFCRPCFRVWVVWRCHGRVQTRVRLLAGMAWSLISVSPCCKASSLTASKSRMPRNGSLPCKV